MSPSQRLERLKLEIAKTEKNLGFARQTIAAVEAAWIVCVNAYDLSTLILIRHAALRKEKAYMRTLEELHQALHQATEEPTSAVA